MSNRTYNLNKEDDVIGLKIASQDRILLSESMFKVGTLIEAIKLKILGFSSREQLKQPHLKSREKWLNEGLDCEVLHLGAKSWKKGKVRINITLEFQPEEDIQIESPLDDIRQNNSQLQ